MYRVDLGQVIDHTHPAFSDTTVTDRDILQWSVTAGIPPKILTGIVRGRIKITDLIRSRLIRIFPHDTISALVDDYDPIRGMVFLDKVPQYHSVHEYYPVTLLSPGDALLCDDGRWLVISSVEKLPSSVSVYSGGVNVTRLPDTNEVTVAVSKKEHDNDDPDRDIENVRSEDKRSQEVFTGAGLSPERESMAAHIMDKLMRIQIDHDD